MLVQMMDETAYVQRRQKAMRDRALVASGAYDESGKKLIFVAHCVRPESE